MSRRLPLSRIGFWMAVAVLVLSAYVAASGETALRARGAEPTVVTSDGTSIEQPEAEITATTAEIDGSSAELAVGFSAPGPIATAIEHVLAGEQGVFGVVVQRPDGTIVYSRNADTPFVSASLYKLVLLAEICAKIEQGTLALDAPLLVDPSYYDSVDGTDAYFSIDYAGFETTVEEALLATGAYSSNVAAKALLAETSPAQLNDLSAKLGLTNTQLFLHPTDLDSWPPEKSADTSAADAATAEAFVLSYASDGQVNLTTPRDVAHFFSLLMRNELVNEAVSKRVWGILDQQVIADRFPVLLPPGTTLAHKTGNLDFVVHDAGVIYGLDGPVILAAMVEGTENPERATEIIQRLALIAYGDLVVPPFTGAGAEGTETSVAGATASPSPTAVDSAIMDIGA